MSIAGKYWPSYTYEDYCQREGRWELIEGNVEPGYIACPDWKSSLCTKNEKQILDAEERYSELELKACLRVVISVLKWNRKD